MTESQIRWRILAAGAATFLVLGVTIWLVLRSISDASYAAMTDELETVSIWLLWTAAVGQTLFIGLWVSLPWWTHWIGRALMVKSLALMTYLDLALVFHYVTAFPALGLLGVILFSFVVIGIWTQLSTLTWEKYRSRGPDSTRADTEAHR